VNRQEANKAKEKPRERGNLSRFELERKLVAMSHALAEAAESISNVMENSPVINVEEKQTEVLFHAGYVAIIGEPNVGKSTLMNVLVGQKVSIVTKKPQTTRHKILGILSKEQYQIIFLDTPGLLTPQYLLHKVMMRCAHSAIEDADIVFMMIDATKPRIAVASERNVPLQTLKDIRKPIYLLLNKTDRVEKHELLPIIAFYSDKNRFIKEIFPISALTLAGIDDLMRYTVSGLPVHPAFYPTDIVSDHRERFFVSEIIREKIFEEYRDEIPYSTTVDVIGFQEQEGRKDVIHAEIYVERDSQKGILIGRKGSALREIGEHARKDIEAFLGRSVFLGLHVKVRAKWREKEAWLKRLGYIS
jgi:GTP-binding protein Era